jgi:hypothetical protein
MAAVLGDEGKAVGLASRRLCCLVPLRRAPMCEPPAVLVLRTVTFDVVGNGSVAKFHPRSLGRLFFKLVSIGFFHRELPATSRLALGIPHMLSGMA